MYRTALVGAYPSRSRRSAKPSMCGPLIPPRRRRSVFGAEKYLSNMGSPCVIGGGPNKSSSRVRFYGELLWLSLCSKRPPDRRLGSHTLHNELLSIRHELYEMTRCP